MNAGPEGATPELLSDDAVPVCGRCFSPVESGANFCATCGGVVGQYTEYVPFVNIAWQASGYDRLRQSTWPCNGSAPGRILGVLGAFFLAPLLLLAVPFRWLARRRKEQQA